MGAQRPGAHRRSPVVDQRPDRVHRRLSPVGPGPRHRIDPGGDSRCERRAMEPDAGMKFSVVIPARNEVDTIAETVRAAAQVLERHEIDYEILVIDDSSTDGTVT